MLTNHITTIRSNILTVDTYSYGLCSCPHTYSPDYYNTKWNVLVYMLVLLF